MYYTLDLLIQFMTVQVDNAADAKTLVRDKVGEKVYFMYIMKE